MVLMAVLKAVGMHNIVPVNDRVSERNEEPSTTRTFKGYETTLYGSTPRQIACHRAEQWTILPILHMFKTRIEKVEVYHKKPKAMENYFTNG
jgi:hypothetical protein